MIPMALKHLEDRVKNRVLFHQKAETNGFPIQTAAATVGGIHQETFGFQLAKVAQRTAGHIGTYKLLGEAMTM